MFNKEEIMVSICCLAYNHEKYISETLKGLINQKTNFSYEIIVHDDASSDNTASIINEYKNNYPGIIKPIFQKENQYKKSVAITPIYIMPKLSGKYVAICEGDDCWIDEYKLQKQFDYMENNPRCTFCFTNAIIENQLTNERRIFIPYSKKDKKYYETGQKDYNLYDFYKLSFIPTASFFFPKKNLDKVKKYLYKPCPTGDLRWRLYLTAQGYAHFIDEKTTLYRENVPNSAMTVWKQQNKKEILNRSEQVCQMLLDLNEYSQEKYWKGLLPFLSSHAYALLKNKNLFYIIKDRHMRDIFLNYDIKTKLKILAVHIIPKSRR